MVAKNSVKANGLLRGDTRFREEAIRRVLANFIKNKATDRISENVDYFGTPNERGYTYFDGKIYFGLSRKNLLEPNLGSHFCSQGSEFDRSVAKRAYGDAALKEIIKNTEPYIIWFQLPGSILFDQKSPEDNRYTASLFLEVWAEKINTGCATFPRGGINWGQGINRNIPPHDIVEIEHLEL